MAYTNMNITHNMRMVCVTFMSVCAGVGELGVCGVRSRMFGAGVRQLLVL